MKVFISWSGERSQALATALREWLPLVLHYVEPWVSEADVAAGTRWAQEVAEELQASNFGIICTTPENIDAPWLLFEAGVLAKSLQEARVVPLLFGLELSDITGPLAQFQAKKVAKAGLAEVVLSINHATDEQIPEDRAKQLFEALWTEFEKKLATIPEEAPSVKHVRPHSEILEELVAGFRGLDSRFRDLEGAVADPRPRSRRERLLDPMLLDQLASELIDDADPSTFLLVLASLLREDFPWYHELLMEGYRAVRGGDPNGAIKAIERASRVTEVLMHGPFRHSMVDSKEGHMMMMEFPMMLDHVLHRYPERQVDGPRSAMGDERVEKP